MPDLAAAISASAPEEPSRPPRTGGTKSPGGATGERMAWLDALRAVAALLVVYAHLSRYLLRGVRGVSAEWLHAGPAGVMLFFLVSGYIIPASLERHGSLRRFWISRLCRLFPLYLVVALVVVGLGVAGVIPLDPGIRAHPVTAGVAHLTMLPFLLGGPLVTPVFWTLTFEMVFYLLVGALFAVRLHRASGPAAIVLAVAAVVTAPLAPHLIAGTPGAARGLTVVVATLLVIGLAAVVSGRRWAVVPGALLLGVLAGTLVAANQDPAHVWDGLLILAVMFTGTTVYRADHGQAGWWQPALAGGVVAVALLANWFAELESLDALTARYRTRSVITLLVFAGAFALAMALRRRPVPRWLAWLGMISYSLYLVHFVLIQVLAPVLTYLGQHLYGPAELPVVAAYLALLIGLSWLAHRYVERPGQRLGRRLTYRKSAVVPSAAAGASSVNGVDSEVLA
jgi:peptidoglycan/LPS O-acetylase OafA/YrhL